MADRKKVHDFATKWLAIFGRQDVNYLELVDHYMGDECRSLGFQMDCGKSFEEKYGRAAYDCEALEDIIHDVTDISLLGSAIHSRWRYFNHWEYSGAEILDTENREWFIMALRRMEMLTSF